MLRGPHKTSTINLLRSKTRQQVFDDVNGFAQRYVQHWTNWLVAPACARPQLFGEILRKWQATRPHAMRRLRIQAKHGPPFLDDLLDQSAAWLNAVSDLDVLRICERSKHHTVAFCELWDIFRRLPISGTASCVGISKAILLLTNGKIGPAFDSQVRKKLQITAPTTCTAWLAALEEVADDIKAFEAVHGPLKGAVPERFAHLRYGRLYDMALGPR